MSQISTLIKISRYYGDDPAYVIAGGGNTSFKDRDKIWIKASGIPLAGIGGDGFVCLSREALGAIETGSYSDDPSKREEEVRADMKKAIISPDNLRPSVETSLHNLIDYAYVIHTHPTLVNALMCSINAEKETKARFGKQALYVEYTDPGFILFKKLQERIGAYKKNHGAAPPIIFLQNHGVFVGADTVEDVKKIYDSINKRIREGKNLELPSVETTAYTSHAFNTVNDHYAERGLSAKAIRCELTDHFTASTRQFKRISRPFSPDIIVYCKSRYLFLEKGLGTGPIISGLKQFEQDHGYYPKVILEEGGGLIAVEENDKAIQTVHEVYMDLMKISYLSESFGGPHFMTAEQIRFIDNWEVEHYRRRVAKGKAE